MTNNLRAHEKCSFDYLKGNHEFSITLRKDRKLDTIKLSSEYRNDILTAILKFHKEFVERVKPVQVSFLFMLLLMALWTKLQFLFEQKYAGYKYHWSGVSLPTELEVTPCSLDQLDPTSNKVLASYNYKDITGIIGNTRIWCTRVNQIVSEHKHLIFLQESKTTNRELWLLMVVSRVCICSVQRTIMKLLRMLCKPPSNISMSMCEWWPAKSHWLNSRANVSASFGRTISKHRWLNLWCKS